MKTNMFFKYCRSEQSFSEINNRKLSSRQIDGFNVLSETEMAVSICIQVMQMVNRECY